MTIIKTSDLSNKKVLLGSHLDSMKKEIPPVPQDEKTVTQSQQPLSPLAMVEEFLPQLSSAQAMVLFKQYFAQDILQLNAAEQEKAKNIGFEEGKSLGEAHTQSLQQEYEENIRLCAATIAGLSEQVNWQFSEQEHVIPLIMDAVIRILEREVTDIAKQYQYVSAMFDEYARDKPKSLKLPTFLADQIQDYMSKNGIETNVKIVGEPSFVLGSYELVLETGSVEKNLSQILDNFKEGLLTLSDIED